MSEENKLKPTIKSDLKTIQDYLDTLYRECGGEGGMSKAMEIYVVVSTLILVLLFVILVFGCASKPYDIQYCEYCQKGGCKPAVSYQIAEKMCWTNFKCSMKGDKPHWKFTGYVGDRFSNNECWHYGLALEDFLNQVNTGQHAVDIFPRRQF